VFPPLSLEKQFRMPHFSIKLSKSRLSVDPVGVVDADVSSIDVLAVTFKSGQLVISDFELDWWI